MVSDDSSDSDSDADILPQSANTVVIQHLTIAREGCGSIYSDGMHNNEGEIDMMDEEMLQLFNKKNNNQKSGLFRQMNGDMVMAADMVMDDIVMNMDKETKQ